MSTSETHMKPQSRFLGFIVSLFVALLMSISVVAPQAAWATTGNDEAAAQTELQSYVKQKIAGNSYGIEGGGTIMGNDLLVMNSSTNQFEVDGVKFSQLDSKSQQKFVDDLAKNAREAANPANVEKASQTPQVTNTTVTNWFRDLQNTPGVGTRMLSEMMGDISPDFVAAHQTLSPFMKGFNLILGLIGVLTMAGLSLTILIDVIYMVVPAVRGMLGDNDSTGDDGKGKIKKLFSVSNDARHAMKKADDENGSTSSALVAYLWKRSLGLLALGVLLVLLVQGKLFNLVGLFMDLVAGLPILN